MLIYFISVIIQRKMFRFNYLLKILLCSSLVALEGNEEGWVALDSPVRKERALEIGESSSIWVLVAKQVGKERVRIRFPGDPEIFYSEMGEWKMEFAQEGATFSLEVLDSSIFNEGGSPLDDLFGLSNIESMSVIQDSNQIYHIEYAQGGRWIRQKWIQSADHWYRLESQMDTSDGSLHAFFTQSFELDFSYAETT